MTLSSARPSGQTPTEAGHEMNALIAEEVFGHTILTDAEMLAEARRVWAVQPLCTVFLRGFRCVGGSDDAPLLVQDFPRYSTEIAAAWAIVEKMRADGWLWDLDTYSGQWTVVVEHPEAEDIRGGSAQGAAPLAICLAALDALEPAHV